MELGIGTLKSWNNRAPLDINRKCCIVVASCVRCVYVKVAGTEQVAAFLQTAGRTNVYQCRIIAKYMMTLIAIMLIN